MKQNVSFHSEGLLKEASSSRNHNTKFESEKNRLKLHAWIHLKFKHIVICEFGFFLLIF